MYTSILTSLNERLRTIYELCRVVVIDVALGSVVVYIDIFHLL